MITRSAKGSPTEKTIAHDDSAGPHGERLTTVDTAMRRGQQRIMTPMTAVLPSHSFAVATGGLIATGSSALGVVTLAATTLAALAIAVAIAAAATTSTLGLAIR